ncbi:helix-turn-helix domain-containing protein [Fusobacterium gastrosuis]|uniref:helix-turn-helix domain-containing protein n=1 Tax=Fusobacterium gastrosuis TaxID=1755100 RepID=UPI0029728644|nr:helix-turn-helix transcriptional regulator [Fusobacteriaceae bacterium]MDY5713661.1 helix-turn-helix transcriptional regulator [Fusobacterium gastrosuis]
MLKIKLSDLMGKHKLTIAKVSELTSLSRPTISALYHEKVSRIDFETIAKLCKLFNCTVGDLIEYVPDSTED